MIFERSPEWTAKFDAFYAGVQKIHHDYMTKNFADSYPNGGNKKEAWRVDHGQVRARVVHGGGVYCFVDYKTGDVLKPSGWKAPAKHARGNIFDEANGLAACGPYGPAYLR